MEILPARAAVLPYPSNMHLLKSLMSVEYNIDEEDENGCSVALHDLIHGLMMDIISKIPDYDKADVWND